MAADEYTSAAGGGLRLKGVSGSKITKHKKKRPKQPENEKRSSSANPDAKASEIDEQVQNDDGQEKGLEEESKIVTDDAGDRDGPEDRSQQRGKTEAELRHEERRRRRVCFLGHHSQPSTKAEYANMVCAARGASQARRHEDAQRESGGIQSLFEQSE